MAQRRVAVTTLHHENVPLATLATLTVCQAAVVALQIADRTSTTALTARANETRVMQHPPNGLELVYIVFQSLIE